jgi:flagellar hook-basal body protein
MIIDAQCSTLDPDQRLSLACADCGAGLGADPFLGQLAAQLDPLAPPSTGAQTFIAPCAAFDDLLTQSLIGGPMAGASSLQTVQHMLAHGVIAGSGRTIDHPPLQSGFFVARGLDGEQFFTRAGQMTLDKDGFLVTRAGLKVQGGKIDASSMGSGDLMPTSEISLRGNLSADPSVPILPDAFDPQNASGTSNFSSATEVFDALGNPHRVEIYFKRAGESLWEWNATLDGRNIEGGVEGTSQIIGFGTVEFNECGALTDVRGNTVTFNPVGSSFDQPMTLNFGRPKNGVPPGRGLDGIVQTSSIAARGLDADEILSRAGQMILDEDGFLVTQVGLRVQGFETDASGVLRDLRLTSPTLAPRVTSKITLAGNLGADPSVPILPDAFDPQNARGTSNFSSATEVFDSSGNPHRVEIYFKRAGESLWEWNATLDGSNIEGGVAGVSQIIGFGTLEFNEGGALTDVRGNTVTFNPVGSSFDQPMTLDFGRPINGVPPGSGLDGIVQTSGVASSMSSVDQDGAGVATFTRMQIDEHCNIIAMFSDGRTQSLGQAAVANFVPNEPLELNGADLFRAG